MLNGIGKDIGLTLTILFGVLLRAKYDGLASVHAVNPVYHLIETFHLLELFGIDIEQILLNRGVCSDAHHDDTGLLVLIPLTIDLLQHLMRRLDNGDAGTGGRNQALLHEVPVLWQVLTESICVQKHTDDRGHSLLLPQLFGTAGGIVRDMRTQRLYIPDHTIE